MDNVHDNGARDERLKRNGRGKGYRNCNGPSGLIPADRERLLKLLRLLSSDQVGERAAAAAKANNFATRLGGWDRIFPGPAEGDQALLLRAERRGHLLSDWDRRFLRSVGPKIRAGLKLTERQRCQLHRIALEVEARTE